MLPEIGATELLVIAAVALIVVGPKDLPVLLRKLGQFMGKLRAMAADFRASFDEMARQSELDELRAEVEAMRKTQLADIASIQASDVQVSQVFSEIDHGLNVSSFPYSPSPALEVDAMAPVAEPAVEAPPAPKPRRTPAAKPATKAKAATKPKTAAKPKPSTVVDAKPRTRKGGTVT